MKEQLKEIISNETEALENLLKLLEDQHSLLVKNDIFALEDMVEKIQICNKKIAEKEVERRKLVEGKSMAEVINFLDDEELDTGYRNIKKLIEGIKLQKDTNELLIRQGLAFTNRLLNVINPDRTVKTYNAYGKVINK